MKGAAHAVLAVSSASAVTYIGFGLVSRTPRAVQHSRAKACVTLATPTECLMIRLRTAPRSTFSRSLPLSSS